MGLWLGREDQRRGAWIREARRTGPRLVLVRVLGQALPCPMSPSHAVAVPPRATRMPPSERTAEDDQGVLVYQYD